MCCNGVLFHLVRLQPADSVAELSGLGMQLKRKKKSPYFTQPCAFLSGTCCSIYEHRPERCRVFDCRQLQAVIAGELPEQEACQRIEEVKARVERVEKLLGSVGDVQVNQPLTERYRALLHVEGLDETLRLRLTTQMQELNEILNLHFRVEPFDMLA